MDRDSHGHGCVAGHRRGCRARAEWPAHSQTRRELRAELRGRAMRSSIITVAYLAVVRTPSDGDRPFQSTDEQPRRDRIGQAPTSPLHVLEDNAERLNEIKALARQLFDLELSFDWLSNTINLRIGAVGVEAPRVDQVSDRYRRALAGLPLLSNQGDGVRSAMGLLIAIVVVSTGDAVRRTRSLPRPAPG